jgi:hypothetical protein
MQAPARVGGMAQRVSYTGLLETDLAIYRFKLRLAPTNQSVPSNVTSLH